MVVCPTNGKTLFLKNRRIYKESGFFKFNKSWLLCIDKINIIELDLYLRYSSIVPKLKSVVKQKSCPLIKQIALEIYPVELLSELPNFASYFDSIYHAVYSLHQRQIYGIDLSLSSIGISDNKIVFLNLSGLKFKSNENKTSDLSSLRHLYESMFMPYETNINYTNYFYNNNSEFDARIFSEMKLTTNLKLTDYRCDVVPTTNDTITSLIHLASKEHNNIPFIVFLATYHLCHLSSFSYNLYSILYLCSTLITSDNFNIEEIYETQQVDMKLIFEDIEELLDSDLKYCIALWSTKITEEQPKYINDYYSYFSFGLIKNDKFGSLFSLSLPSSVFFVNFVKPIQSSLIVFWPRKNIENEGNSGWIIVGILVVIATVYLLREELSLLLKEMNKKKLDLMGTDERKIGMRDEMKSMIEKIDYTKLQENLLLIISILRNSESIQGKPLVELDTEKERRIARLLSENLHVNLRNQLAVVIASYDIPIEYVNIIIERITENPSLLSDKSFQMNVVSDLIDNVVRSRDKENRIGTIIGLLNRLKTIVTGLSWISSDVRQHAPKFLSGISSVLSVLDDEKRNDEFSKKKLKSI